MAPFLVSFPFSLAPPIVTHGSPPVCFFYILFSFDFFPLFLFFCKFSFPSLPFSPSLAPLFFPFFLSLSLLLSFLPLLFGAPLRPPGVQAHAMHPPGYATVRGVVDGYSSLRNMSYIEMCLIGDMCQTWHFSNMTCFTWHVLVCVFTQIFLMHFIFKVHSIFIIAIKTIHQIASRYIIMLQEISLYRLIKLPIFLG